MTPCSTIGVASSPREVPSSWLHRRPSLETVSSLIWLSGLKRWSVCDPPWRRQSSSAVAAIAITRTALNASTCFRIDAGAPLTEIGSRIPEIAGSGCAGRGLEGGPPERMTGTPSVTRLGKSCRPSVQKRSDEETTHFSRPHITHPSLQIADAKDAEADQPS